MSRRKPYDPDEVPAPWIYEIHDPTLPLGSYSDERVPGGDNRGSSRRVNTGDYWTKEEIMEALDALPRAVREALENANHPWAPHWAKFTVKYWPPAAVIARIERADREAAFRRELQLLAGKG